MSLVRLGSRPALEQLSMCKDINMNGQALITLKADWCALSS